MTQVLSYIVTYQVLLYVLIVLTKKYKQTCDWYLAIWLVFIFLSIYTVTIVKSAMYEVCLSFTHGALFYLYTQASLYMTPFKPKRLLHFVPALLVSLLAVLQPVLFHKLATPIVLLVIIFNSIYFYLIIRMLSAYRVQHSNSHTWLSWFYLLIYCFIFFYLLRLGASATVIFFETRLNPLVYIISVFLCINIIGLKAFHDNLLTKKLAASETGKTSSYANYGLKEADSYSLAERLKEYMEEKKPYINAELSLNDLATALDVFPHYLTQLLSTRFNQNFYDFVNTYRIEEVKREIVNPEKAKFTMFSIAYDCGFKSQSTFNRIFKQKMGVTPSEYLKSL